MTMNERTTTRLFGLGLGGVFLIMLTLDAMINNKLWVFRESSGRFCTVIAAEACKRGL